MPAADVPSPKFYVENLGCAKNQVDAETMIAALKGSGWEYVPQNPEQAHLIIVNTCGFIRSAQEESVNTLLAVKKEYPDARVLAAGCLAQRWAGELSDLIGELDGVFGNGSPGRVAETLGPVMRGERPVFLPGTGARGVERPGAEGQGHGAPVGARGGKLPGTEAQHGKEHGEEYSEEHGEEYSFAAASEREARLWSTRRRDFFGFDRSVYVKISDGCNHRCRYCAIPLIKGNLRSRPAREVLDEVKALLDNGVYELNLVAQDLASFGVDAGGALGEGLVKLLRDILDSAGSRDNFRLRLLYLHPDIFPRGLLDVMAADSRVLPYLDLPFQHASASVLRQMGRSGSFGAYLALVEEIRRRLPDAVIRSTFLVGHPGEGRREFRELLRFQEEAALDWLGVFAWSREEGTPAARARGAFAARLGAPAARRRQRMLEERQQAISAARLERWVGREVDVLAEEPVEGRNLVLGRGPMNAPEVDGSVVVHASGVREGDVLPVRITGVRGLDLQAAPAGSRVE